MSNLDTEFLFPARVIPELLGIRGDLWHQYILDLVDNEDHFFEKVNFVFLMVRLCGCAGCNADSFRAMRGCTYCAKQTIKRYKGSDEDLLEMLAQGKNEVKKYLDRNTILSSLSDGD
jgi:hypothetical protein